MNKIVKRNIVLIGSMGSGKSHFGRNLALQLGWQFVDTDRVLEVRYGLPIADIYEQLGEKGFRKAEAEVLKKVSIYHEAVISVGGNFPLGLKTLRMLKEYSYIIGIRAAQYRIVNRVNRRIGKRPTMDYTDVAGFVNSMMQWWKPVYKKCDYVLDTTNGRTLEMIQKIHKQLQEEQVHFKPRRNVNKNSDKSGSLREMSDTVNVSHMKKQRVHTQRAKSLSSPKIGQDKNQSSKSSSHYKKKTASKAYHKRGQAGQRQEERIKKSPSQPKEEISYRDHSLNKRWGNHRKTHRTYRKPAQSKA